MSITFKHNPKGSTVGSGNYIFRHYGDETPVVSYGGLCFTAQSAGSTVGMSVTGTPTKGQIFEYSTNGSTWSTFTPGSTTVTLSNIGSKVYFRGNNTTVNESLSTYYNFTMTGSIAGSGNIMSLLDTECESVTIPSSNCFRNLFEDCTSLISPPELPATALSDYCYYQMFFNCSGLTAAPELPATTLKQFCYFMMFYGCSALTAAPVLSATSLKTYCYTYMFGGCSSLTTPPALPATSIATHCYESMFDGCVSLTVAPTLPASAACASDCYNGMFYGCTSLTTAPALPFEAVATNCYKKMFYGCTSLTAAPSLPATLLGSNCYESMFQNCTNLTTVPNLPSIDLTTNCYMNMFNGCTSLYVSNTSTAEASYAWNLPTTGTYGTGKTQTSMFAGCLGTRGNDNLPGNSGSSYIRYTQNQPV